MRNPPQLPHRVQPDERLETDRGLAARALIVRKSPEQCAAMRGIAVMETRPSGVRRGVRTPSGFPDVRRLVLRRAEGRRILVESKCWQKRVTFRSAVRFRHAARRSKWCAVAGESACNLRRPTR